jgi:DNA damage-binding protein 1
MVDGHLAAALVKNVAVFALGQRANGTLDLVKRATYRTATIPIAMTVHGREIAVADMMKSLSILEFRPKDEDAGVAADELVEVARHYQLLWATAVARVDADTWLEADAEGNLVVLARNREGVTDDDKRHLQVVSEIRLGELVNTMRTVEVSASPSAVVVPKAFIATVSSFNRVEAMLIRSQREGSLYLFALITEPYKNLLMNLQANMADHLSSPGDLKFNYARAFANEARREEEPKRFVDGAFLEGFLDATPDVQAQCVLGLARDGRQITVKEACDIVETLKRLC